MTSDSRTSDSRRRDRDRGFTLVELLISVAILTIVMGPLSMALIVSLRTTDDAQHRITESRGAQIAASFFTGDVQSARTVTVGSTGGCGAGTPVVSFAWSDDEAAAKVASYALETVGSDHRLVRTYCRTGLAPEPVVVVHELGAAPPEVACTPSCAAPRQVTIRLVGASGYEVDVRGTRRSA